MSIDDDHPTHLPIFLINKTVNILKTITIDYSLLTKPYTDITTLFVNCADEVQIFYQFESNIHDRKCIDIFLLIKEL